MASSKTAEYVAFYRALEDAETRRAPLFRDAYARALLPRELEAAVRFASARPLRSALERYADWRAPGARSSAIGRTRFIDDMLRTAVADGTTQIVVLGAGFDCRAHRMSELAPCRVFEVDRPETQAEKRGRLARVTSARVRPDVAYVAVDFQKDDVATELVRAGWSLAERTAFVWEGVTNYLNEDAVGGVLSMVARAAPSSEIVFTYIHRGVLDGSERFLGAEKLVANVRRLGEPWTFGLLPEELSAFVARFGLDLREEAGADSYRARYLSPQERGLRGYAFYRIALARVPERNS